MKSWTKILIKFVVIIILCIVSVIYAAYKSYMPVYETLKQIGDSADAFNETVDTVKLINNVVTRQSITNTINKFNNANKDIFLNNSVNYLKMSNYTESTQTTIQLKHDEYAFLMNSIKNCDNFLIDNGIDFIIQNISLIGDDSTYFYKKILVKIDIGELVQNLKELRLLSNNLYVTITFNRLNEMTYSINELEEDDNNVMKNLFNGHIGSMKVYKGMTLTQICQKAIEEYDKIDKSFRQFTKTEIEII